MSDPAAAELLSSGMDSGSDAGRPGDQAAPPPVTGGRSGVVEESEDAARAAVNEAPLPAEGGPQDDGLEPEFDPPQS